MTAGGSTGSSAGESPHVVAEPLEIGRCGKKVERTAKPGLLHPEHRGKYRSVL